MLPMVVGYGNHHGVQALPTHENSNSGMATNPTAAQGLPVKSKRPLTKGCRWNWSPVWKGWLIHRCLLSAVFGVTGMTKEDVPRRPAVWSHAKNLHLLVLLMGERADITCCAKFTAQRELVWKRFILPWGEKKYNSNYYLWSINKYFWKVSIFSRLWLQSFKIYCLIIFPSAQTCKFYLIGTFHFTGRSFPSKESLKKLL